LPHTPSYSLLFTFLAPCRKQRASAAAHLAAATVAMQQCREAGQLDLPAALRAGSSMVAAMRPSGWWLGGGQPWQELEKLVRMAAQELQVRSVCDSRRGGAGQGSGEWAVQCHRCSGKLTH